MKHFIDTNDQVHALEPDGSQDFLIKPEWRVVTDVELSELRKPPQPTQQEIADQFVAAIQERLDNFARTRNYDGILSACTYATSTVAKFKSEGQACVNLRDATWAAAYELLGKVQAGQRQMPSSLADIEADLPALEWPQ